MKMPVFKLLSKSNNSVARKISSQKQSCCRRCCDEYGKNVKTHDSILDFIGNTPLVKLNNVPKDHGVSCEIYAKCEFFNPGGSIKDRIAYAMMQDAQKNGDVKASTTLVEPTSGNTGISLALNCALSGNKCIIVAEDKASDEKVNTIQLFGAEVIQVTEDEDEMAVAFKISDDFPDHVMLNQFDNEVNPKTHYEGTGLEIVTAMGGSNIDMVVMGAGTGGTMTGVGTRIKEMCPDCKIVVSEPKGSTMICNDETEHSFLVEGIGGTWVPSVLDKSVIDYVEFVDDEESFLMARELARKEGLLCGGSSGTAMVGAIKAAKRLNFGPEKRIVVILPDGIRNYMTKFVSDQWMEAHLFIDPPQHTMQWWNQPITDLILKHTYPMIQKDNTCAKALTIMKTEDVAIVVDDNGQFLGAISKDSLRDSATNPRTLPGKNSDDFNLNDPVTRHLVKHVYTLAKNGKKGIPTIGRLSRILDITPFVVIGTASLENDIEIFIPEGVATGDDVLDHIVSSSHHFGA